MTPALRETGDPECAFLASRRSRPEPVERVGGEGVTIGVHHRHELQSDERRRQRVGQTRRVRDLGRHRPGQNPLQHLLDFGGPQTRRVPRRRGKEIVHTPEVIEDQSLVHPRRSGDVPGGHPGDPLSAQGVDRACHQAVAARHRALQYRKSALTGTGCAADAGCVRASCG
ncbi:hypothetical protein GCM10009838_24810 [Catenulispora subtropica]|uniref:Uncharacterized protein n=1 Tax=Catenulispora subtropica TaxID=450798 RepID=A0ABP5CSD8_9ACTN